MVNFFGPIQESDRLACCRPTVIFPVNNLPTTRVRDKESSQIFGLASASSAHPILAQREPLLDGRRPL